MNEDLLLTLEEQIKAIKDAGAGCLFAPSGAFVNVLLQAQLDKVLKPEHKKDLIRLLYPNECEPIIELIEDLSKAIVPGKE